jgi:hypothetical protein
VASLVGDAPVIRAAIAALKASLPAQIALFNAQPANEITLAEPVAYEFGAADPLIVFPTIEVAMGEGSSAHAALGYVDFDHRPTLTVVAWHEGERGELGATYEMSLGLKRCVLEVLTRDGAFGPDARLPSEDGTITWRTGALPAELDDTGREFKRWQVPVLIAFRLETVERFS